MENIPNTHEAVPSLQKLQDYLFLNRLGGSIIDGALRVIIPSSDIRLEDIREHVSSFTDMEVEEVISEPQDDHEKGLIKIHTFVIKNT